MIREHHIEVKRTARYYTLGNLNEHTKEIWWVLHGYGHLAGDFINEFECIQNEERFIIAPEALSRFYWKGYDGKPAATWMTKEDRENEIADYVHYLDKLIRLTEMSSSEVKKVIFGFSQGVATGTRLLAYSDQTFDRAIWWAGTPALDLSKEDKMKMQIPETSLVYGDNDQFIDEASLERIKAYFDECPTESSLHRFEGRHEILPDILKKMV